MLTEKQKLKKREYYLRNREHILRSMREKQQEKLKDPVKRAEYCENWRLYSRKNYESRVLAAVKSKCKRFNIEFNLDITDIVIPTVCPKTGIPLVIHTERGKFPDTPSIDRIDPNKGYIKGNIQIVSFWYNIAKLNWDERVFIDLCRQVTYLHDTN